MHLSLGTIKLIAKAIEYKFPGSCTDLIKSLDEASHHPAYMKYRMKEVQDKWNEYKNQFNSNEISNLSEKVELDLGNPKQWDNIIAQYHPEIVVPSAATLDSLDDISDSSSEIISEPTETDFWDNISDFFSSIFD